MTRKIDSHHHFWHYTTQDYGWISDNMKVIRRDFLPADLQKEIHQAGINGVVSVQARQVIAETEWLLSFARQNAFIDGVVGWVPLIDAGVGAFLDRYAAMPKLRGIRHVLHDEADDNYMLRADFNRGIDLLKKHDLRYDILIFEKHLPQTLTFVDKHPNQVFIVDHIAKPKIKEKQLQPWRDHIGELAKRQNVYCKLSGMVTEADWSGWTEGSLKPYVDTVLGAFTPKRVMFGSDWPVCLVASSYKKWVDTVTHLISKLSASEQERVMGGTAIEAYKLKA